MEYELNRLNENEDLRQQILQISEIDDTAGFDIMSFDGEKSTGFDRMIEVKATTDENPHFFFSGHEVEVASELKNKYWIYLWTAVFGTPKLTKIKNPYENVFIKSKVKPEPVSFYINKNLIENIEQS